jgi:outer membrane murein-binding lipoprotein Lpp
MFCRLLIRTLKRQGAIMADFTKLNADIAALSAKVDELLAKVNPPPVDEQPAVDEANAAVEAIMAKIT